MCAGSGNRVQTAAASVWQWGRKEWSNAKKISPERLKEGEKERDGEGRLA